MGQPAIEFIDVSKQYDGSDVQAVDHVSLSIEQGELVTILGSSGCGKTTLLKMINRLYEPTQGVIRLLGQDIRDRDVVELRRGIGYVIQQVGLFPHMTVAQNIATVPHLVGWSDERIQTRTRELLELVELEPDSFMNRYPSQLSGGQQQRVGLARALAVDPAVMLLDEPFGAIDAITRMNLQDQLIRIHGGLKKTFIFVTHDISEAFKLGTRVIVMSEGRILQFDTPRNIVRQPANAFVARLIASAREQDKFWEGLD